jgi:hypothetical protein
VLFDLVSFRGKFPLTAGACPLGSSDFTTFSKIAMLHVVLNRQKISKTITEKAFFFIVWRFYLFAVFVLINFKIDPSDR